MDSGNQIFIFLICVTTGIAGGAVYEALYGVRCACRVFTRGKPCKIADAVCDAGFFLVFAAMCVGVSVLFGFPDFRFYMYAGNLLGLVLYLKSVHRMLDFFLKVCYNGIKKVVKRRKSSKNKAKKEVTER